MRRETPRCRDGEIRAAASALAARERIDILFGVVEESEEAVKLLLREGVEFVVVALSAAERGAEPDRCGRVDPVDNGGNTKLLGIDTPLLVNHGVAVKAGRDLLIIGRVRKKIAGDLLDRELIVGKVAIERVNDPVAIEPDLAPVVLFVPVRVGITRQVEPGTRPALTIARRRKQPVDELPVCISVCVGEKVIDFRRRGR